MRKSKFYLILVCWLSFMSLAGSQQKAAQKRPMTFMDIITLNRIEGTALSPNRHYLLYEISSLNWKENKRYSDLYLSSVESGPLREMTFTRKKNETSPKWHPDSSLFAFLSDRNGKDQIFFMRPDGGEAWQVTDKKEGVISFDWNKDGSWLVFLSGKEKQRQLWLMPGTGGKTQKLTDHSTPVESWLWAPDGRKIYFIAPDKYDQVEKDSIKKGFDVKIVDPLKIPHHLWQIDLESRQEKRLTSGDYFSVQRPIVSDDGCYMAFIGASTNRYASRQDSEVYLLDLETGKFKPLTQNQVAEYTLSFSPDSRWLAFNAADDFTYMRKTKIYLYSLQGEQLIKLPQNFDLDANLSFWSKKGDRLFFNCLEGITYNLYAVNAAPDSEAMKVTDEQARLYARKDKKTGLILIYYTDPHHPSDIYLTEMKNLTQKARWLKVTDSNPQVKNFQLADYETIHWTSTDGQRIEGILIYPLNYQQGQRYPLIVQIHGGPASAYTLSFSGSYGTYTNVLAAHGYALFQPNYRGSSGYGEKFRMEIAGDYFHQAFEDIMSGVDYLIEKGIADPDKLAMMGWSAGGHWSNWTLVSTDRFKAISTGAGAVNWISLYAQTDVQDTREFYFKGRPYNNWDDYVRVSPLKYITKAKTPTLIHFGEKDRRIPKPQGDELHMALKKLGVPTEFIVYPNMPHGLRNARYQLVKMEAEFAWFEKWIKGKKGWLDWKQLLDTLQEVKEKKAD